MIEHRRLFASVVIAGSLLTSGCDRPASSATGAKLPESYQIDTLSQQVADLERRLARVEREDDMSPLKLGDEGFDFFQTGTGGGTLQWVGSKDNGNGTALRLKFGNPSSASWTKYTIIGLYGKLDAKGDPITGSASPFTIQTNQKIPAGSWKTITVQLDGPKSQDVGYLSISAVLVSGVGLTSE